MKTCLWILLISPFLVIPAFTNIATSDESSVVLVTTFGGAVAIYAVIRIGLSLASSNKHSWPWLVAWVLSFVLIAIPHFWMAKQLAPERNAFEHIAQTGCNKHFVKTDADGVDRLYLDCGGALDAQTKLRNKKLNAFHFIGNGEWRSVGKRGGFSMVYFYNPF